MRKPLPLSRLRTPNVMRLSDIMPPEMKDEDLEPMLDAETNVQNRDLVIANWMLGPEKTSVDPAANVDYWQKIAAAWNVTEEEARRQLCANCEYFNNSPAKLEMMEAVPLDAYDMDGGGRGYCTKFDFICHSLRACQAWEEKEFEED